MYVPHGVLSSYTFFSPLLFLPNLFLRSSVAKKTYYTDQLLLFEDRKIASLPPSSQHTHTHLLIRAIVNGSLLDN